MLEHLPDRVTVCDVAPRDGLQMEPGFLPTEQKQELIRRLIAAGVAELEVTSFVHPKWIPALADSAEVGAAFADAPGVRTKALVPNMKGLENAHAAGMRDVVLFMSASESHNKANVNKTIDENLTLFAELIPTAQGYGMTVEAVLSTALGCPFEGEVSPDSVASLVERLHGYGADRISVADTIGVANPLQVKRLLEQVLALVPAQQVGVHFHDTYGMAVANALAALEMGVRRFDGSLGGLGGCPYAPGASGNVPTEHLVYLFEHMGVATGIDLEALYETAAWLQDQLGHDLPSTGFRAWRSKRTAAAADAPGAEPEAVRP